MLWKNKNNFISLLIYILSFIILIYKTISSSQLCIPNSNNCLKCNPLTKMCAICNNPEIYIPDNNGGCIGKLKCFSGKNYCNECDEKNELCQKCENGYYPDEYGACTYTENCKISYKGECINCKENYIKVGKNGEFGICKYLSLEDFKHCKNINYEKGYCEQCEDNFYLTSEKKCIRTNNCKESIFGNCVECQYGYYYNRKEDKCEPKSLNYTFCKQSLDNKNCEICNYNNYFDENGICIPTNYCSKSINLTCIKCISGYYLSDNFVCTTTDNCSNGDKDIGICNSCKKNFYLDTKDYKCKNNLENNEFKYCILVESDKCIKCEKNFYLGEDNKCSFSNYCSESKNGICLSCSKNYYLDLDNLCSNVEHCVHQSNDYYNMCIECKDGYYYSKKYKKCYESNNSTYNNCKYSCDQLEKCCKCKDNFYLRNNDSLCFTNLEKGIFYKCAESDWDGKFCWECAEPYYLGTEDHLCSLADNCAIIENEFRCKKCMEDFCLDINKGMCFENYKIDDDSDKIYFACNRTNEEGNSCEECLYGFQVGEKGLCININNCTEIANGICIKCDKNYCSNDDFGCLNSYDPNCVKCNNYTDFNWCSECEQGFIINSFGFCELKKNDTNITKEDSN